MIKAVLVDFDGTLVRADVLDVLCGIVGKEEESKALNADFHSGKLPGLAALVTRINFLRGMSLRQINEKLDADPHLAPGAVELFTFLKQNKIVSILNSGNIVPVLGYYQKLLGIDYAVGTQPKMDGEVIVGIEESDIPGREFKLTGVRERLATLSIEAHEALALGDSPADIPVFNFVTYSVAVNPKSGIEKHATYTVADSLAEVIPIIQNLNK